MKHVVKCVVYSLVVSAGLLLQSAKGQSVLNPLDSLITYNPANPPAQPAWGQIGKWVRKKMVNWSTDNYKAYIYKGASFRLRFPKSYNPAVNDGKKYPLVIFLHGYGEADTVIYDNEFQLYHGSDVFDNAINNGAYDGYVLFMQSPGYWGSDQYQKLNELVDYMVANNKVDPFHVFANGLSAGGQGVWEMVINKPTYFCGAIPFSWTSNLYKDTSVINKMKYIPFWVFQGDLDGNPAPYTTYQVRDAMVAAGANFKLTEYPNNYHNTWDNGWQEPDFFPFVNRAYSSNPWPLGGKSAFFPDEAINATLGLTAGYQAYQWRKDGSVISGATANTLNVNQAGVYDARVQLNGVWSDWSHVPVTIKVKAAPPVLPAKIEAENYVAMSGIQTEGTTDVGGGQDVGWTNPSDYMDYDINVPTAGAYTVSFRVASPTTGSQFQVLSSSGTVLATQVVPNTGGWQTWQTVSTTINFSNTGNQTIRLLSNTSGWNINWLQFTSGASTTPPPSYPVPGIVQAENYSAMSRVQTENTTDSAGGMDVGWIDNTDWMDYTINVSSAGSYNVALRIATPNSNAQLEIRNSIGTTLATVKLPSTGGFQTWKTVNATVSLPAGIQTIRVISTASDGWNFNWMNVTTATTTTVTNPPPPATGTTTHIEAETYSNMSGVVKETTTDTGGGQDVGYIDPGDWMDYAVNLSTAGTYTVKFRVASASNSAQFQLRNSSGAVLATINVPNTGGWQTWQTVTVTASLPAGVQTLRLISTSPQWNSWNINWFDLIAPGTTSSITARPMLAETVSEVTGPAFGIYPNPVQDGFVMKLNNAYSGPMRVQIVNMSGAVMKVMSLNKQTGISQNYLNIGNLPQGKYVITVDMNGKRETEKIIKL